MVDIHAIFKNFNIDPLNVAEDDLKIIMTQIKDEIQLLATGPFYFSEVSSLVETLVEVYHKYGKLDKDQVLDIIPQVFQVLDQQFGIIKKMDDLIPASNIPYVGKLVEEFDDKIMSFILYKVVLPLAIKTIERKS